VPSLYRDPLAGLRSQIATKRGLLESRERVLPELLRAMLPAELSQTLSELRARAVDSLPTEDEAPFEVLTTIDAALDEILTLHDEAANLVPKLRECPDEVPDPAKPIVSPPWVIEERAQLGFRAVLTRRLASIAPEGWLVRWDDTTYLARIRVASAPVILTSRFEMIGVQRPRFSSTARTSVPHATPALDVRRDGFFDGLGRAIGLVRDLEVGHELFDRSFVVQGTASAAAHLLGVDVTAALLRLEGIRPRLTVGGGIAELAWGGVLGTDRAELLWPDDALGVVLGVRAAIERA
jgi:hypothetical protein